MKLIRVYLCASLVALFLALPAYGATTVVGTVRDAAGTLVTGKILLTLSQEGTVPDPALILGGDPNTISCEVTAGIITACVVRGNDEIQPAGTRYYIRLITATGQEILPRRTYNVFGASWDIGTQTPLPIAVQLGIHGESLHSGDIVPAANQNFGAYYSDFSVIPAPANPASGTRRLFINTVTGEMSVRTSAGTTVSLEGAGGASSFTDLTSGTNLTAAMLVGSGASLGFTGTGTLNAKSVNGVIFSNFEGLGKIPIGQGDGTAAWADPLVQGTTAHDAAGSTTNPVLSGCYASAAAPADVSADIDAVRTWCLRSGAIVSQLVHSGVLIDPRAIRALTSSDVVSAAQSGTWTVQPGNTANTTAWLFKLSQTSTDNDVDVLTLPALPTGANTIGAVTQASGPWTANQTQLNSVALASPFDADTGAGTQNLPGVSLRKAASGGSVELGTSTDPVRTDPTGTTTQPVSGTVTANAGTGTFTVSGTVTANAGTNLNTSTLSLEATQADVRTSVQLIDDVVHATNAALGKAAAVAGQLDDTASTAATEDNVASARITAQRALHANLRNNAGTEVGTSGAPLRTDPTGTTAQPVTDNAGSLTVDQATATNLKAEVVGPTADNAANPTAKLSVLPARANASAPTWTEGNVVPLSVDTSGALRTTGGGGGTQYAEDTVHASGDTLTLAGVVQQTADAALSGDGDRSLLQVDASGFLKVNIKAGAGSGGTAAADNSTFTGGTTNVTPMGALYDTTPPTITDGNVGAPRMDVNRLLMVNVAAGGAGDGKILDGTAAGQADVMSSAPAGTEEGLVVRPIVSGTQAVSITAGNFPDNEPFNVAQMNGVAVTMNAGAVGTGVQRVVLANNEALPPGTNIIGALTANQSVNVNQIAGSAVSTAAAGVQKVGVVGNAGATVDSTVGAGTAPTNQVVGGSVFNATAPAPTTGQAMAQQADQSGNLRTIPGMATATLSAWTSGTSVNATQNIFTNSGVGAALVHLVETTTITAGAITFEVTYDNTNWVTIPADAALDPASTTFAQISLPYTLQASTNKPFLLMGKGWQGLRIKLSTAITGTGSVTPNYALLSNEPAKSVIALSPTAANFNATATLSQTGSNNDVDVLTLPALVAGTANIGDVDVLTLPALVAGTANIGDVDVLTLPSVTIVTFPDNEPFNLAQVAGTATVTGGVAGSQGVGGLAASGAAKAGSPVQVGGVFNTTQPTVTTGQAVELQATARGALIVASGVDNMNVAQATAANLNMRPDDSGATGSAVPARAVYIGGNATGNLTGMIFCDNTATYNAATSGSTQLVALTASQIIYICGYTITSNSATGVDVKFVYGTGTNCATGPTDMTPPYTLDTDLMAGMVSNRVYGNALKTAASNALCLNASAAVTVRAEVQYTKF